MMGPKRDARIFAVVMLLMACIFITLLCLLVRGCHRFTPAERGVKVHVEAQKEAQWKTVEQQLLIATKSDMGEAVSGGVFVASYVYPIRIIMVMPEKLLFVCLDRNVAVVTIDLFLMLRNEWSGWFTKLIWTTRKWQWNSSTNKPVWPAQEGERKQPLFFYFPLWASENFG